MTNKKTNQSFASLLNDMVDETDGAHVTIGQMVNSLDTRSFGPLLLLPALIAVSPLGMVPGMSIITGTIIFLIAIQVILCQSQPWLPGRLLDYSFSRDKLELTQQKITPWLQWAQRPVKTRLTNLVDPPFEQVIAVVCMLLSVSFIPLALIPFGVFLPGLAVVFFAIALTARDGMIVLFGLVVSCSVLWALMQLVPG